MTVDEIIGIVDARACIRIRYEDRQHEHEDEILVAEIRRLREKLEDLDWQIGCS